jgi:hypothetical protein
VGLTFGFVGDQYPLDKYLCRDLIKHYGGTCIAPITTVIHLDYIILGRNPPPDFLEFTQESGFTHIRQAGLFSLIQHEPANGRRQKRNNVERPRAQFPPPKRQRVEVNPYRMQTPPPPEECLYWVPKALEKLHRQYPNDRFDCEWRRNERDPAALTAQYGTFS